LQTLILQGTPFERGRQHGLCLRAEINGAVSALKAQGSDADEAARARATSAWSVVKGHASEVASEIEGIAAGAESDPIDILLRSGFEYFGAPTVAGCSAVAASGPNGAIVAQNWDAPPAMAQDLALFLHFGPDGFEQAIVASCGGLCWVGCNHHGLALVNNDLLLSSTAEGLPSQIVRRLLLAERSVTAALARLRALPHMGGRSYLLGDASGAVAGVEVSVRFGVCVNQVESPVLHANHALHPEIAADEDQGLLMATHPSSRYRQDILQRKFPPACTPESIALLLSDKEGAPNSISKAISPEEPTATLFSVIVDCGAKAMLLCAGAPGDNPYQRLTW
jgi:isopenicillin-N N-acyltransferase like protein